MLTEKETETVVQNLKVEISYLEEQIFVNRVCKNEYVKVTNKKLDELKTILAKLTC